MLASRSVRRGALVIACLIWIAASARVAWQSWQLWHGNWLRVTVGPGLSRDQVRIRWWGQGRRSRLVFDGKRKAAIGNSYGENQFDVRYGHLRAHAGHFKTSWRHLHEYHFHFYLVDDRVRLRVRIDGADAGDSDVAMWARRQ